MKPHYLQRQLIILYILIIYIARKFLETKLREVHQDKKGHNFNKICMMEIGAHIEYKYDDACMKVPGV